MGSIRYLPMHTRNAKRIKKTAHKRTLMNTQPINRPLHANCSKGNGQGAKELMPDYIVWGDSDTFKLISKFSSESAGIMKSTKAMQTGDDVVVQVTTQQRNPDGSYSIAEALTTVLNCQILETIDDNGTVISRRIA